MTSLSGVGTIDGNLSPELALDATLNAIGSIDGSLSNEPHGIYGNLSPELALDATLSAAGQMDGSLSTEISYNMLRNLPRLNGVTIQGSKVSRDYDIPTVRFDTSEHWAQCMEISESNTVYVYTDYSQDESGRNIAAMKIGDGTSYIVDLPFTNTNIQEQLQRHISDRDCHITAQEREYWNNKKRSDAYGETLVLTTL